MMGDVSMGLCVREEGKEEEKGDDAHITAGRKDHREYISLLYLHPPIHTKTHKAITRLYLCVLTRPQKQKPRDDKDSR